MNQMKKNIYSVGQVNTYIKNMFTQDFFLQRINVQGEVSNCKYHSSGHIYFTLKDQAGAINCIMFAGNRKGLTFPMKDGDKVVVTGSIEVYERDGKYQLYARTISLYGEGDLYRRYEALKQELEEMGMFAEEYKQPIPKFAKKIGIVTAPTGAAIQDIRNISMRRNPYVQLILYPALVQGEGAKESIVNGIHALEQLDVDLIIVGRGGGSIEELWNFNEEALAEEIFHSELPIISAVGHEIDYTISDFVADLRASTPSQAGELAVPLDSEIYSAISEYENYLNKYMIQRFNDEKSKIDNFSKILSLNSPMNKIVNSYLEVERVKEKLDNLLNKKIAIEKQKLISLNNVLQAHSPLNILSKGYAIIEDENGNILKETKDFNKDMNVKINLSDGMIKGNLKLL